MVENRQPSRLDLAKVSALAAVRRVNRRSLEKWSRWTYRTYSGDTGAPEPRLVSAKELYQNEALPPEIKVLAPLPRQGRLSRLYVWPYYGLAALAFRAHRHCPIGPYEWDPSAAYASLFPGSDEGWGDIQEDEQFATLRLQGPNPFLLRADGGRFVVDYSAPFAGVWEPVRCHFELQNRRLVASAIDLGAERILRNADGWERAKLIANALDARYAIFGQHLTTCHFLVAQAFAIAAHCLPAAHGLAPMTRLFTNGVLEVNDFALRLLLNPDSYFLQSGFISPDALFSVLRNRAASFSADELDPMRDIEIRGLAGIPDHPYVADAKDAWAATLRYTEGLVAYLYESDQAVRDDESLRAWHECLRKLLPNSDSLALLDRQSLAVRLGSMIYNNVVHEVSGDFSPYTGARAIAQKVLVSFAGLRQVPNPPPMLANVFLFEQGAYAGTFNVAGNNLLKSPLGERIPDRRCRALTRAFRDDLRAVERNVDARNQNRTHPFRRMRPSQWELSVSF